MMKGVYVLNKDQLTTLREEEGCGICKELKDEDEGLRGTLFWALYGDMVMFDTYANAIKYQDGLNRGDKRRDILVEEDGTLLRRNGYMDVPKGTEGLKKLPIVFGPMPLDHKPERRQLTQEIEQLVHVVATLKGLAGANAEVARIRNTFNPNDGLENEYQTARECLQKLSNLRRVRHRDA
ncbi:hypothetical protein Esi_0348_0016 [Ectocarpus siliculosus]|uniref:Uncharacterized protein n=1 Tax=Ectocarpus siliculosus TaxID=2880 RepID=D7FYN3_ECTSI|nr:hypothetical protein Esi_0348_0016 [Ectocarpus siliculosus]|eukprot:CBJ32575.1 hypothetical protein Esi_0348_0016 [Ectocarpus siliculosus]